MGLHGPKDHSINKDKQRINNQSTWLSKICDKNQVEFLQRDIGTGKPLLVYLVRPWELNPRP